MTVAVDYEVVMQDVLLVGNDPELFVDFIRTESRRK